MDKALFRAYVKELVKEQIDETVEKAVKRILPEILTEVIAEIKKTSPVMAESTKSPKPMIDRGRLAELMGLERHGDTISATTETMQVPPNLDMANPAAKEAVTAITRDYSEVMKAMGLSKKK